MIGHHTCFTYTHTGKNFINFGIFYVALSDSGKDYSNYSPGAKNDPPPPPHPGVVSPEHNVLMDCAYGELL